MITLFTRLCLGFLSFFCLGFSVGFAAELPLVGEPPLLKRVVVDGGFVFSASGVLQPNDSQFVHDVYCGDTGSRLGTVRMCWGYKYGARYGGVGYAASGPLLVDWVEGGLRVRLLGDAASCTEVVVVPRLMSISDAELSVP
jgi:hypothetical protein